MGSATDKPEMTEATHDFRGRMVAILCGVIGIAWLSWFAWHFALERIYMDSAYFLLNIVKDGHFHLLHGRWIIPLIQWPAVVGVQLGLPLRDLITLYAIGNIVTLIIAWLFVTVSLKDHAAGIALVATQFIGLAQALFCPVFEFYHAAMLLVVFLAILRSDRLARAYRILSLAILYLLILSSHFTGVLVMLMTLVLVRIWRDRSITIMLAALLIVHLLVRFYILSSYEQQALGSLFVRAKELGSMWLIAPGRIASQLQLVVSHYLDTLLLTALVTAFLVQRRDHWGLGLFIGGLGLLYVLTSLYFPDPTHSVYREIVVYPLTVWVIIVPLVRFRERPRIHPALVGLLVLVAGWRMVHSIKVSEAFVARRVWMQELIAEAHEQGIRRAVVPREPEFIPAGHLVFPLAPVDPYETILLSGLEGRARTVELFPVPERAGFDMQARTEHARVRFDMRMLFSEADNPYLEVPDVKMEVLR